MPPSPRNAHPADAAHPQEGIRPRRLALLDTDQLEAGASSTPLAQATTCLLDDLAEAYRAYERIAGVSARELPQIDRLTLTPAGGVRWEPAAETPAEDAGPEPISPLQAIACADALVIGYARDAEGAADGPTALLERMAHAHSDALSPGTRVYAIGTGHAHDPHALEPSFAALERACRARGLSWCGVVAAGGGATVARWVHTPRMGFWRRSRSEAIDRLIAAMRCGLSIAAYAERMHFRGAMARAATQNAIYSRCPLPRPLYQLAVRMIG